MGRLVLPSPSCSPLAESEWIICQHGAFSVGKDQTQNRGAPQDVTGRSEVALTLSPRRLSQGVG